LMKVSSRSQVSEGEIRLGGMSLFLRPCGKTQRPVSVRGDQLRLGINGAGYCEIWEHHRMGFLVLFAIAQRVLV
ncbi:hypothetical protein KI387_043272, partial [Taxus chinensis]